MSEASCATWPRVSFDYSGCTVLVTGGTSGIGAAIAAAFVRAGADVTITGTRSSADAYAHLPAGVNYQQLRLECAEDVHKISSAMPALDILVNNAGGVSTPEDFSQAVHVNLIAVHQLSMALYAQLKSSDFPGGASIVNIASMMSFFGSRYFPGYSSAKGGLLLLTKSLAIQWASDNIRVNAVAAGSIVTPMTRHFADDADIHDAVCRRTPMGRWGEPADIAGPVLSICSPASSFITGHTLVADGGYSINDN